MKIKSINSDVFLLTIFISTTLGSTICYFPDHSVASNFTTCNAAATYSACCRAEDACLSNGLCLQQGEYANRIIRGACTDQTFSSTACPSECTDTAPSVPVSIYLAWDAAPQGNFCCVTGYNMTSSECSTPTQGSSDPFQLAQGTVIYDRSDGSVLPQNWTDTSSASASSVVTVTATATATATASASGGNITTIAVGIAVPLGVLLIAALVGCGVLYSQLKKARQTASMAVPGVVEKSNGDVSYGSPTPNSYASNDGYAYQHVGQLEAPQHGRYVAEMNTEREIPMADSRGIHK